MNLDFDTQHWLRAAAVSALALILVAASATGAGATLQPGAPYANPHLIPAALGDTDIDAETQTGRYSLLVRQIQLRLAEIGLYGGRIGGVMSAETAEAIRTFQRFISAIAPIHAIEHFLCLSHAFRIISPHLSAAFD